MPSLSRPSGDKLALLTVLALALLVRVLAAIPIHQPGYMDAYYYYHVAANLYQGRGLVEDFIWNYLSLPASITHPSHQYWMPLTSILVYLSFLVFGEGFRAAQVPGILLSALFPLVGYWIGRDVFASHRYAWTIALLTIFSGIAFPFWSVPDSFAAFALTASTSLLCAARATGMLPFTLAEPGSPLPLGEGQGEGCRDVACNVSTTELPKQGPAPDAPGNLPQQMCWLLAAGFLVGLAHLTRPDGVLLLPAVAAIWWYGRKLGAGPRTGPGHPPRDAAALATVENQAAPSAVTAVRGLAGLVPLVGGYLLAMAPWFVRNTLVFGSPLPGEGTRVLFLTDYNDLFAYGKSLTLTSYVDWGLGNILLSKLRALGQNLVLSAELLLIYMVPFAIAGLYLLRRHPLYRGVLVYAALLLGTMSLAFTFPGPRGSFFHSSVALLPFLFGAALLGLDRAVLAAARVLRHWDVPRAQRHFGALLVLFAVVASAGLALKAYATWDERYLMYNDLAAWVNVHSLPGQLVMVADPPGYYYSSGRASLVGTSNTLEETVEVGRRWGVRYVALEDAHPYAWREFYLGRQGHPDLRLAATVGRVRVYEITPP